MGCVGISSKTQAAYKQEDIALLLDEEKLDKTKKSRTVIQGYEQETGVDFVKSYSPLAMNTTINVVHASTTLSSSCLVQSSRL